MALLIAEIGNNHEGDFNTAIAMIEKAADSGADLIKFQAGLAEGFARYPKDVPRYKKYELGLENYRKLVNYGKEIGIPVFFSIWSNEMSEFSCLDYLKIAARQYDEYHLKYAFNCNVFVSIPHTASLTQVNSLGCGNGTPLHCVSEYPAEDPMLWRIGALRNVLDREVGYSDHTIGIKAAIEAVNHYGATVIEKHFTLDHRFGGEDRLRDHALSATPDEFLELALAIKPRHGRLK